jgi:hypothetical protein
MSMTAVRLALLLLACFLHASPARGQEAVNEETPTAAAEEALENARQKAEEIAAQVDQSEQAHEVSAGILRPIYQLAEFFSFAAFHWVAFALMVTGVASFALQLVLAKLVVLAKRSFSITEVLSDALGLAISLVGLVLTTQAAAENSTFTSSPAAVLSATAVGVLLGIIFYWWGQAQEVQAVQGRRLEPPSEES